MNRPVATGSSREKGGGGNSVRHLRKEGSPSAPRIFTNRIE